MADDLAALFDSLIAVATGQPLPKAAPAPEAQRCVICHWPGKQHAGPTHCVLDFQSKMAALEDDPGWLPAPAIPMPTFEERKAAAFQNWLRKPPTFRARHPWVEPIGR